MAEHGDMGVAQAWLNQLRTMSTGMRLVTHSDSTALHEACYHMGHATGRMGPHASLPWVAQP